MINLFSRRGTQPQVSSRRADSPIGRLGLEQLEHRALLAIDSGLATAQYSAYDVNRDGYLTTIDALQVVNQLNRYGAQAIGDNGMRFASAAAPGTNPADLTRFDVNNDGRITQMDALMVINQLNDPDLLRIRLEVTDTNGNPISQIQQNGDFQLRVYVQDLRGQLDGGVFAAYTDVEFDPTKAEFTGNITAQVPYDQASVVGSLATPGIVDDAGTVAGSLSPLGPDERLLFFVPLKATGSGTLNFSSNPADSDLLDVGLYNSNEEVPADLIEFGTTSLEIVAIPTVSIGDVTLAEGNSGTTDFNFVVSLSAASDEEVTVDFETAADTATADSDFVSQIGSVVFAPGETSKVITIAVNGDAVSEPNETFFVNLTGITGPANLDDAQGLGTILDDDGTPSLSINDVILTEGNAGTKQFSFTVSLSGETASEVTVDYQTVIGTATAGVDFVTTSGSLTFAVGETSKTVMVTVIGDTTLENDETFTVQLSNPNGAQIIDGSGTGTIQNDDAGPNISIADAGLILEPITGTTNAQFVVTLSQVSDLPVTVSFSTEAGTASTADFLAATGTLTFEPGETQKTISIQVNADDNDEIDETFFVNLAVPTNGVLVDAQGQATIRDQVVDKLARVRLSFTDLNGNDITEARGGDEFYLNVFVQDIRDVPANEAGIFQAYLDVLYDNDFLSVVPGTTQWGDKYPNQQEFQFSDDLGLIDDAGAFDGLTALGSGELLLFRVRVRGLAGGATNVTADPAETLDRDVLLFGSDTPLAKSQIQFLGDSIDILPPSLVTTTSASVTEGDAGVKQLVFTVNLARQDDREVTVAYSTVAGTATAGADYQNVSGTLTFGPGVTSRTINVPIIGDVLNELDEGFLLNLTSVTNAVISPSSQQVVGTILNDDAQPTISFDDVTVTEGVSDASITVRLSAPSGRTITVDFSTGGGSATPGVDYSAVSGTLTFAPGETEKTIVVPILIDADTEANENTFLTFSNVLGAVLARPSATITIQDTPPSSISGFVYRDADGDGLFDANEFGLGGVKITLLGPVVGGVQIVRTATTDLNGAYSFGSLPVGTYIVRQEQLKVLEDGAETLGSLGPGLSVISANDEFTIFLGVGVSASGYNFAERGYTSNVLTHDIF